MSIAGELALLFAIVPCTEQLFIWTVTLLSRQVELVLSLTLSMNDSTLIIDRFSSEIDLKQPHRLMPCPKMVVKLFLWKTTLPTDSELELTSIK